MPGNGYREIFFGKWLHAALIVLLGIAIYSNTFRSPFQWDERKFIEQNPIVRDLHYFTEPSKAQDLSFYNALRSRYIGYLTFALNYRIHGTDVLGFHIVNLLIHIINALLVYFFVLLTFRTPYFARLQDPAARDVRFIALLSSLLFVAHPVQTEAVTYIFQRLASLVTMFYLLSIVLYIRGRLAAPAGDGAGPEGARSSVAYYVGSVISAVLAMKTKENAFTLPLMISVYEFLFFSGPVKARMLRLIPFLLTLPIVPSTFIGLDRPRGQIISQLQDPASAGYHGISKTEYLITQLRVVVTYIRLLLLPVNQNLDYDYPRYISFSSPAVIASFLFLLAAFGSGVYLIFRSHTNNRDFRGENRSISLQYNRLIGFGIIWFFITLSVESSIIPVMMVIDEYRIYLPSVGAFTSGSTVLYVLSKKIRTAFLRRVALAATVTVILIFSADAYLRNSVWSDRIVLWEDVVKKSPRKARPHYNLANLLKSDGRIDEAITHYQAASALSLDPRASAPALNNMGEAYYMKGMTDKAVEEFKAAIAMRPDYGNAHNNLANAYAQIGRLDEAVEEYELAIKSGPEDGNARSLAMIYYNLGMTYMEKAMPGRAIGSFESAIKLAPAVPVFQSALQKASALNQDRNSPSSGN
jgi:tetratricopeptide (TPR) repeat protein